MLVMHLVFLKHYSLIGYINRNVNITFVTAISPQGSLIKSTFVDLLMLHVISFVIVMWDQ